MIERESDLFCKLTTSLSAVAASVALCAFASAASGATLKGVVVHKNSRAHSFVVADRQGHLSAVHVKRGPRTGKTLIVTARALRNGTWSASKVSVGHAAHRARIPRHGDVHQR